MKRQHLSKTQNAIASSNRESAIAQPQSQNSLARSSTHPIEELQGAIGNQAVNRLLANQPTVQAKPMFRGLSHELAIQPKLAIGAVGDKYEREADRVASQVVNQINTSENQTIQREEMSSDEALRMQAVMQHDSQGEAMATTPALETSINQAKGSGQPLPSTILQPMQKAFGADFRGVRVHADAQSDRLNQSIQAKAFTTGQNIFFKHGEYNPGNQQGQELLAHELTHVVQQNGNAIQHQMQTIPPKIAQTTLQPQLIQRTEDHAKRLASLYAPDGTYNSWKDIYDARNNFLPYQWKRIKAARRLGTDGMPVIYDRSGNAISNELLSIVEQAKLDAKKQGLNPNSAHMQILTYLEQTVNNKFGPAGVVQFYRGAHIVFRDNGAIYNNVKRLGMPIAATNPQSQIMSKTEFVGMLGANFGMGNAQEQRAGKMFTRRPEDKETSHYQPNMVDDTDNPLPSNQQYWFLATKYHQKNVGYDSFNAPPQLGIDLPESVGGHILVGIVPHNLRNPNDSSTGHTFVQTEGAGFQNFNQASIAHGKGYFANAGYTAQQGTQTGLLGTTLHSEKTNTEIREHENVNPAWTWNELYTEALDYAWKNHSDVY
jgi:hypothetical protein